MPFNIHTWSEDTRERITKEEEDRYNAYLCSFYRAYMSREGEEFIEAIKDECRKWTHGNLETSYLYRDIMDLGRLT